MDIFDLNNKELIDIVYLFFNDLPSGIEIIDTSHGDMDFRETVILEWVSGERKVLKISNNDFTFSEKLYVWKRSGEEYRKCGYYCPEIFCSKNDDFPTVQYKGRYCIVYAEEYSKYHPVEDRDGKMTECSDIAEECRKSAFRMTAVIASKHFDFSEYPSGYCLFEKFCSRDAADEVFDNALEWKKTADKLPEAFHEQTERIWKRWNDNRHKLEAIYNKLPTSVFQADLNLSNLLVDDCGNFQGVFDFNLCGRDVYLNYLFREIWWIEDEEAELSYILNELKDACSVYTFTDEEKKAALLIYRHIKPLWFTEVDKLKKAGTDALAVSKCLDETESKQTREIDFDLYMK